MARAGVLVVRVWQEDDGARIVVRVTSRADVLDDLTAVSVISTIEELVDEVEQWFRVFLAG